MIAALENIDSQAVLLQHLQLDRSGRGPCPFCEGNSKRTFVLRDPEQGKWTCFRCGLYGDVVDFVQALKGVDFKDAVAYLTGQSFQPVPSAKRVQRPKTPAPPPADAPTSDEMGVDPRLGTPTAAWIYTDPARCVLFRVLKYRTDDGGKTFRQHKWDSTRRVWLDRLYDAKRVLFRLPEVLDAVREGRAVWLCEGEKDADSLRNLGHTATTAPMGAHAWKSLDAAWRLWLKGADVRLTFDDDEDGKARVVEVYRALKGVAESVKVYGPDHGNDVTDHLDAGGTVDTLIEVTP